MPGRIDPHGRARVRTTPFGPVTRGETEIRLRPAREEAKRVVDPGAVEREDIPRFYERHAREYIDSLAKP